MDRKKDIQKELEELSPFLAELKEQDPFKVPENYFKNLSDEIWKEVRPTPVPNRTVATESAPATIGWLDQVIGSIASLFQPRLVLSLASVAVLVLAGIYLFNNSNSTTDALAEEPFIAEASDYIANNVDEFDTDLFSEVFDDEDIAELTSSIFEEDLDELLDELLDANINSQNIEDYL